MCQYFYFVCTCCGCLMYKMRGLCTFCTCGQVYRFCQCSEKCAKCRNKCSPSILCKIYEQDSINESAPAASLSFGTYRHRNQYLPFHKALYKYLKKYIFQVWPALSSVI